MEEFLPSEVARSVYGYLISEGCEEAAKVFLETSPNLEECKQLVKKGRNLTQTNTCLLGRTLAEVLNIGCTVHSLVRQANDKRLANRSENGDEGWTGLFDQLRSFILAETVENLSKSGNNSNLALNFSFPKSLNAPRSEGEDSVEQRQVRDNSSQELNTPKRTSLHKTTPINTTAEDFRSLVEECQEGLDLSLSSSPQKTLLRNLECLQNQPSIPFSTSKSTGFGGNLDFSNQSAAHATTQPPQYNQVPVQTSTPSHSSHQVPTSTLPLPTSAVPTGSSESNECTSGHFNVLQVVSSVQTMPPISCPNFPQVASTYSVTSTVSSLSQPIITSAPFPGNNFGVDGISRLPDPPIILLDNQNQPMISFDANDPAFFGVGPCAASTPHPIRSASLPPEDTAIIIYPPAQSQEAKAIKTKKRPLRSSSRHRKILPKPPLKVLHINVLPQVENRLDEEKEDEPAEVNEVDTETDLATELPNLNEEPCDENTEVQKVINSSVSVNSIEPPNQSNCSTSKKSSDENEISSLGAVQNNPTNEGSQEKEIKTPKPPIIRKNISRSTPRRNSHVRALSFTTPNKPFLSRKANTSPKVARSVFSPRTSKLTNVKRSALFKSPTSPKNLKDLSRLTEEDESESGTPQNTLEISPLKVPIATRSPAPKLSSAWKEVTDVTITAKPQWDEKIRNFMTGNFVDPAPPPKSRSSEKKINSPSKTDDETKVQPLRRSKRRQKVIESPVKNSKSKSIALKSRRAPQKNLNAIAKKSPVKQFPKKMDSSKSNQKKNFIVQTLKNQSKKVISPEYILRDSSSSSDSDNDNALSTEQKKSVDEVFLDKSLDTTCAAEPTILKEITTSNILLDDLVVSSNSNFPLAEATVGNENETAKIIKVPEAGIISKISDASKKGSLEDKEKDLKQQVSPKFALPNIPVQETPLKEFHKIVPLTPILNTPFLNIIRRETSILEEDLLLTPSLPPTPQVDSPCHPSKTPCKASTHSSSSPKSLQKTHNLPQIVTKTTRSPVAVAIESKDIVSPKRSILVTEDKSRNQQNIASEANVESFDTVKAKGVLPSAKLSNTYHQQMSSSSKEDLTSSTSDSSDEELLTDRPELPKANIPPVKTRILQGDEVVKKSKALQKPKNKIYTTTDTSDTEDNVDNVFINKPKSGHMLKLASMLLENERRMFEKQSKQISEKKTKCSTKQLLAKENSSKQSFPENRNSESFSLVKTGLKNKLKSKGKFPKICFKSNNSAKPVTPEKKILQNELLKQTRKEIYGESYYPSSGSESDDSILEKKKIVVKSQVVAKAVLKKKISEDKEFSSKETPEKIHEAADKSTKCVTVQSPDKFILYKNCSVENKNGKRSPNQCFKNVVKSNQQTIKSVETISSTIQSPRHNISQSSQMIIFQEENANRDVSSAKQLFMEHNLSLEKTKSDDGIGTEDVSSTVDENISESVVEKRNSSVESETSFKSSESTSCKPTSSVSNSNKRSLHEASLRYRNTVKNEENTTSKVESSCNSVEETSLSLTNCKQSSPIQVSKQNTDNDYTKTITNFEKIMCSNSSLHQNSNPSSFNTSKLDLNYTYQFDAEGKLGTLSVSESFSHLLLPSNLDVELNQSLDGHGSSRENDSNHKNSAPSKGLDQKKRRIKLIPVNEANYKQKLQIDYDVVDGKVISKRRDRKISGDCEFLDISCSTIDADFLQETTDRPSLQSVEKVDFTSELKVLKANKDTIQNKGNETSNEVLNTSKIVHKESNREIVIEKNINESQSKKYSKAVEERLSIYSEQKSNPISNILNAGLDCMREKDRYRERNDTTKTDRKMQTSQLDRRKEIARVGKCPSRERYNRPYDRSDHRRYSRERSKEDNRRRRRSPPKRSEKDEHHSERQKYYHSNRDGRRYNYEKSYSRRSSTFDSEKEADQRRDTERRKYSVPHPKYKDVDYVESKEAKQSVQNEETYSDPRAKHSVTYSDIEKESSTDEAPSLMDFAVLKKPSTKRVSFQGISPLKSDDVSIERLNHPSTAKRKAPLSGEELSNYSQTAKKMKIGEVDMEQAKNVIEQKTIGALLDKLHPDTSNEATVS